MYQSFLHPQTFKTFLSLKTNPKVFAGESLFDIIY